MEAKQYEYKGRDFEIIISRDGEGYTSHVTELGDTHTLPSGYTYRERADWEWSSNYYPLGFGAFVEATNAIRQTVDDDASDAR